MDIFYDLKLQIGAFAVVAYVAYNYFTVRRQKSPSHLVYSVFLIDSLIYLFFDMVTVFTVNNLDKVSPIINRLCHNMYLSSLTFFMFLVYCYSVFLAEGDSRETIKKCNWWVISWIVMVWAIWALPLEYLKGAHTNYSMGPAAYVAYVCAATYFLMAIVLVISHRNRLSKRKRQLIFFAYGVQIVVLAIQMTYPETLISSIAPPLFAVAYFTTVESPDVLLIEKLRLEKQSADKANRAKSDFLANMSHEIRTPMNTITGMTEMILRESSEQNVRGYASNIKRSSNALLQLINEILDSSKIESGKMQINPAEYRIANVIYDMYKGVEVKSKEKGLYLDFDVQDNIPSVLIGDEIRVKQVMTNLLSNAVKYTSSGGITVAIRLLKKKNGVAKIRFEVKDTGIGIKKEDISRVLVSYERIEDDARNVQGTGLGLSITTHLLKLMGSELEINSVYGKGTVCAFELEQEIVDEEPIGDFKDISIENEAAAMRFVAPDARVLVVDDDEMNLIVFSNLIKRTQIQVETAQNAMDGLDKVKNQNFDMVFLDHMMPEVNGIELRKMIMELPGDPYKDVPIIVLTANAVIGAKEEYLEAGFTDFLAKPIVPVDFDNMILKYLDKDKIQEI